MVESDFETDIEKSLLESGYEKRKSNDYDINSGFDENTLFQFLYNTQPDNMKKIEHDFGNQTKEKIIDTIIQESNDKGLINVIRNGIKINDEKLELSYRKPQSQKNKKAHELYQKNIFSVIRQLRFNQITNESIDLAIFLNGFPIATAELKDQFSGQTVEDAQKQYMNRNTLERIFSFKIGAIVHFAIDYDNIFMTTKLENQETKFLPFNKPDIKDKKSYPTSYLWKEIWDKDNLLNIIQNFIHFQVEESKIEPGKIVSESIIFPRYHQWDVVNEIILDTKEKGPGNRYLVEHSTGSGKSFSIAWLAYALHSVRDYDGNSIFDGVIVISDRTIIVNQLRNEIKQFDDTEGLVPNIKTANELGDELEHSSKIIVSTQQKFFDVQDRIDKLGGKHYAVIVDEAQSSQGGDASERVMEALVDLDDFGQKIKAAKQNISYFAFSGTPKEKTLAVFGTLYPDGKKRPFHKYTMKQAIDEGFILDVLKNYTTLKRLFRLVQKGTDKQVDAKKAIRQIMQLVNEDPKNISKKSQFIVEHFKTHTMKKIGGKAKAMVVTEKRSQAVLFKQTIDDYIEHHNLGIKTLVAFSGTVTVDGKDYTENSINNLEKEKDFDSAEKFTEDDFKILIVADKFRVGFNQPKLHTMYVDKKLKGANAVQTLSRLNRTMKGKDDVCVVDFANTAEEIQGAYSEYYTGIILSENIDSTLLYKFYQEIMDYGIIIDDDVETFWELLRPASGEPGTNEELVASTADAVHRYVEVDEQVQGKFKQILVKYVENYAYLIQVNDYDTENLEKLFRFGRKLLTRLPDAVHLIPQALKDDVAVRYIDLKKTFEGSIALGDTAGKLTSSITVGKIKRPNIIVALSELLLKINEQSTNRIRTDAEVVCMENFVKTLVYDQSIISEFQRPGNTVESILLFGNYAEEFNKKLEKMEIYNPELYVKIKNDLDWKKRLIKESAEKINEEIKARGTIGLSPTTNNIAENKDKFRTVMESCKDYLWFEERHLSADRIDVLEDAIEKSQATEIRILCSAYGNPKIDGNFIDKIKKLQAKLIAKNIILLVKVGITKQLHKKIHDRFAIGSNNLWSLPPISAILDGSTSTFNQHIAGSDTYEGISKEYSEWWDDLDAIDAFSKWDEIKKVSDSFMKFKGQQYKYNCVTCNKEFTRNFKIYQNPLCDEHFKPRN